MKILVYGVAHYPSIFLSHLVRHRFNIWFQQLTAHVIYNNRHFTVTLLNATQSYVGTNINGHGLNPILVLNLEVVSLIIRQKTSFSEGLEAKLIHQDLPHHNAIETMVLAQTMN